MRNRQDYLSGFGSAIFFLLMGKALLFIPALRRTAQIPLPRESGGSISILIGLLFFHLTFNQHKTWIYRLLVSISLPFSLYLAYTCWIHGFYLSGLMTLALGLYPALRHALEGWLPFPFYGLTGIITMLGGLLEILVQHHVNAGGMLVCVGLLFLISVFQHRPGRVGWLLAAWTLNLLINPRPEQGWPIEALMPILAFLSLFLIDRLFRWSNWVIHEDISRSHNLQAMILMSWGAVLFIIANLAPSVTIAALPPHRQQWITASAVEAVSLFFIYSIWTLNAFLNRITQAPIAKSLQETSISIANWQLPLWTRWLPLLESNFKALQNAYAEQEKNIAALEKHIEEQRLYIREMEGYQDLFAALQAPLDKPVAAQITANFIQRLTKSDLVVIMLYEPKAHYFVVLATANATDKAVPTGYRQSDQVGLLGRAFRTHKTQVAPNTLLDADHIPHSSLPIRSEVVVPLIHQGYVNAALIASKTIVNGFSPGDIDLLEKAGKILLNAWERTEYKQKRDALLQYATTLSKQLTAQDVLQKAVTISRQITSSRFAYGAVLSHDRTFKYTARIGFAPKLAQTLQDADNLQELIMNASRNAKGLHIRDISRYPWGKKLQAETGNPPEALALPIRIREHPIGIIMVFEKKDGVSFNAQDHDLLWLWSNYVGASIENIWLYEELRNTLRTTNRFYQLSLDILKAPDLETAAERILQTAYDIIEAQSAGIVITDTHQKVLARAFINSTEDQLQLPAGAQDLQNILITQQSDGRTHIYLPLKTDCRSYGIIWLVAKEENFLKTQNSTALQTLSNNASIALERTLLLIQTRKQAQRLEEAYRLLENSYDETLAALMSALDARDRETEGHSVRVSLLACELGKLKGLSEDELKVLERGALLHDIGKIGISDAILHKPGPLTKEEWEIMRQHPDIGANIVKGIPFLAETVPIIRYHQERWDGSGYPQGLKGTEIPLAARIFAVVDALDALTSTRPYRKKISLENAVKYLQSQSGKLFDPEIIDLLLILYRDGKLEQYLEALLPPQATHQE